MNRRALLLVPALLALAISPAGAGGPGPILHEPIPSDPADDLALHATVENPADIPAAIDTPSGLVRAPDLRKPPTASEPVYDPNRRGAADLPADGTFRPDRNTKRPDVLPYDDPFTPSTAPFKRLQAFDAVNVDYSLRVRTPRRDPVTPHAAIAGDGSEEQFFADLVVDARPGTQTLVPSVGPGARVVSARLAQGPRDVAFTLTRDGADEWYIATPATGRTRLVMELTIPRATFGGEMGNPGWTDFPAIERLPPNVAAAAQIVAAQIGVGRTMPPREVVRKLVAYTRSFVDSDEPPRGNPDIYLDLALSQKGVCRHRAFVFLVTALSLGIPTRLVLNEAHAWVEVLDPSFAPPLWRRIDLGGAARTLQQPLATDKLGYEPPPDPFPWPSGATRGDDLADRARSAGRAGGSGSTNGGGGANATNGGGGTARANVVPSASAAPSTVAPTASSSAGLGGPGPAPAKDERPLSMLRLSVTTSDVRRGGPLRIRGDVTSDGDACANILVEIVLRPTGGGDEIVLGSLATSEHGLFEGPLVVPPSVNLGDYDVAARTAGDTRCGPGEAR